MPTSGIPLNGTDPTGLAFWDLNFWRKLQSGADWVREQASFAAASAQSSFLNGESVVSAPIYGSYDLAGAGPDSGAHAAATIESVPAPWRNRDIVAILTRGAWADYAVSRATPGRSRAHARLSGGLKHVALGRLSLMSLQSALGEGGHKLSRSRVPRVEMELLRMDLRYPTGPVSPNFRHKALEFPDLHNEQADLT